MQLFFHFGWEKLWDDPPRFTSAWPGIGEEVAQWIVEREAALVGSDAATDETGSWSVHHELVLKNGIFNLEYMKFEELLSEQVYEFLFVFTPLRLRGATGSPGRPLAIR